MHDIFNHWEALRAWLMSPIMHYTDSTPTESLIKFYVIPSSILRSRGTDAWVMKAGH